MNILLVDDEETILHVVGNFLTACGHDVHPAQDGVEAYEILMQHGGINMVISDIRMPRLEKDAGADDDGPRRRRPGRQNA